MTVEDTTDRVMHKGHVFQWCEMSWLLSLITPLNSHHVHQHSTQAVLAHHTGTHHTPPHNVHHTNTHTASPPQTHYSLGFRRLAAAGISPHHLLNHVQSTLLYRNCYQEMPPLTFLVSKMSPSFLSSPIPTHCSPSLTTLAWHSPASTHATLSLLLLLLRSGASRWAVWRACRGACERCRARQLPSSVFGSRRLRRQVGVAIAIDRVPNRLFPPLA